MTVDTTYAPAQYTGDGSTAELALGHLVYEASHVLVTINGVATSAWSATGYGSESGISVTFDTAPADGAVIVIQRIVPYTQDTDLEDFDGNPAEVTEKQFDLLAMADQQIAEQSLRAILSPIGASLTTNTISGTIDTTQKLLAITTSGPSVVSVADVETSLDAVFTSLASGDFAQYNGTNWVNVSGVTADSSVTNAKLSDMAQATIKGRASGGGTGAPEDLTAAQVRAIVGSATTAVQGLVEAATTAEMTAGTANRFPDAAEVKTYVDGQVGQTYTSSNTALVGGTLLTFAHGLGAEPFMVQVFLVCKGAENGYSIGDVIAFSTDSDPSNTTNTGIAVRVDATNVYLIAVASSGVFTYYPHKSTGVRGVITNTNWDVKVKAALF